MVISPKITKYVIKPFSVETYWLHPFTNRSLHHAKAGGYFLILVYNEYFKAKSKNIADRKVQFVSLPNNYGVVAYRDATETKPRSPKVNTSYFTETL
jgi:hypothetical protein